MKPRNCSFTNTAYQPFQENSLGAEPMSEFLLEAQKRRLPRSYRLWPMQADLIKETKGSQVLCSGSPF